MWLEPEGAGAGAGAVGKGQLRKALRVLPKVLLEAGSRLPAASQHSAQSLEHSRCLRLLRMP